MGWEFDLFAVDTLFKPARKAWDKDKKIRYCNATYMVKDPSLHMSLKPCI